MPHKLLFAPRNVELYVSLSPVSVHLRVKFNRIEVILMQFSNLQVKQGTLDLDYVS